MLLIKSQQNHSAISKYISSIMILNIIDLEIKQRMNIKYMENITHTMEMDTLLISTLQKLIGLNINLYFLIYLQKEF